MKVVWGRGEGTGPDAHFGHQLHALLGLRNGQLERRFLWQTLRFCNTRRNKQTLVRLGKIKSKKTNFTRHTERQTERQHWTLNTGHYRTTRNQGRNFWISKRENGQMGFYFYSPSLNFSCIWQVGEWSSAPVLLVIFLATQSRAIQGRQHWHLRTVLWANQSRVGIRTAPL
jgi:hypothetical protein